MAEGENENESREANAGAAATTPEAEPQHLQDDLHENKGTKQLQMQFSPLLDTQEKQIDAPIDLDSNPENPVESDRQGHGGTVANADELVGTRDAASQQEDVAPSADASKESASELKHSENEEDEVSSAANADNEEQDSIMRDQPESEAETEVPEDVEDCSIQGDVDVINSSMIQELDMLSENQKQQAESLDEAQLVTERCKANPLPKTADLTSSNPPESIEIIQGTVESELEKTPIAVEDSDMERQSSEPASEPLDGDIQQRSEASVDEHKDVEASMDHSEKQAPVEISSTDEKQIQESPSTNEKSQTPVSTATDDVDEEQHDVDMAETVPNTDVGQAETPVNGDICDQEKTGDDEDVSEAETFVPEDDEDLVQANAAELSELAEALDRGETNDQGMEKVLEVHEDTEMTEAAPETMPEGEQWFVEEDMDTEGYAIAIPTVGDDEALETSFDTPTKQSGLKRKRPTSEPYTGEVVEISSDEEKTSKHSSSNRSSSSSGSSSSNSSSSSSSGSDSSDTENHPPPKRQVPIPVPRKRVSRTPARPPIAMDDYKIFKDVDPLMRDTPILKGKYSVHGTKYARFTGVWGFSADDFGHPEKVSKFEYTTRKMQGRRENDRRPVSGRYMGYFNFRQFGGKIMRIKENVVELDFRKIRPPESLPSGSDELVEADLSEEGSDMEGDDAQYVVYGKGKNRFGRFLIHGYLNPGDGRLVVRRKYLE